MLNSSISYFIIGETESSEYLREMIRSMEKKS